MAERGKNSTPRFFDPDDLVLRAIFDALPSSLFLTDWVDGEGLDYATLFLSPYFEEITGIPRREVYVVPDRIAQQVHRDDVAEFRRLIDDLMESESGRAELEYRIWHEKKGQWRWVLERLRVLPSTSPGRRRVLGMIVDITRRCLAEEALRRAHQELKENQEHLVHSEKMASLGILAAGVAHEINNPVGYASSNLETLAEDLGVIVRFLDKVMDLAQDAPADDLQQLVAEVKGFAERHDLRRLLGEVRQMLRDSREGLRRVRDIVEDLKGFARPEKTRFEVADINEQIRGALRITGNELSYRSAIHTRLGDLPRIRCRPGQLTQVFTNLLLNAAQAISSRGRVVVESALEENEIVVRISDTGEGIPPENIKNLFSPFFTTKPAGQGTGLGLSVSFGIIKEHHGRIDVESTPGEGSTFIVRLPVTPPITTTP